MAVSAVVKTGVVDASGTPTPFTETGFGTPDAAIVFRCNAFDGPSGNPTGSVGISVGFWDGTTQTACCIESSNRYSSDSNVFVNPTDSWTIANTTDGVTITANNGYSYDRYATVILLKGLTNVSAGTFVCQGGGTVSGLGFSPNFVLFAGTGDSPADSSNPNNILSFGAARTDGTNITNRAYLQHNETSILLTDKCIGQYYNEAITWSEGVSSFDSGGFTLGDGSGSGDVGFYLAMELPNDDDGYLDIIDTKGSTGTQAYTGVGFEPVVLGFCATGSDAAGTASVQGTIEDLTSEGVFFGADDGTTKAAHTYAREPGGGVDESEYVTSASLYVTSGGTAVQSAYVDSFDSDGFTLQYDTSGAAVKALVFGFGDSSGGGATIDSITMSAIQQTTATATVAVTIPT